MLEFFSRNKANYNQAQIFPFLIAVICVLIILAMITVNLGQLGVFKTDTSNAADAGALAGASVLSSTLLGLGLKSDAMCGRAIEELIVISLALCSVIGAVVAIIAYVVFLVESYIELAYASGEGMMGWTNAKKTAVQYAFNNVGVDEIKPSFNEFLKNAYGISDPNVLSQGQLQTYYDEYMKGESPNYRRYGQTGFSRFLADGKTGYWNETRFGKVKPGSTSTFKIVSGYGWNDNGGNSYDDRNNYRNYENWAEVKVMGSSLYILWFWNGITKIAECLIEWIKNKIDLPWWLDWLENAVEWVIETFASFILKPLETLFPMGLRFMGDGSTEDERTKNQVDNNPILVEVRRYKRSKDLGLWNFRYGETRSSSQSHAFCDQWSDRGCYITPTCPAEAILGLIGTAIAALCGQLGLFDTEQHLFETELEYAY
jgi:uncharacterized protein YqgC (DUF456 family)